MHTRYRQTDRRQTDLRQQIPESNVYSTKATSNRFDITHCWKWSAVFVTGRNAGIKITFVSLFLVPSPRRGDSMHRISSNLAGRSRPPTPYLLPKLKIFGGYLGNSGPKRRQKRLNNLENAIKNSIFAPYRRIPWSKIMKLIILILLDGLHLYFNFGRMRFINDGFITKKIFGTKKPRNLFLAPSAKTRDRIQK